MLTRIRAMIVVGTMLIVGLTSAGCARGPYVVATPREDVYYQNGGYYNAGPYYNGYYYNNAPYYNGGVMIYGGRSDGYRHGGHGERR